MTKNKGLMTKGEIAMAEYPEQHIKNLDAAATKEAWPLVGMFLLDMVITIVALYIVGSIINSII
jgi:hypothetical protein